MRAPCRWVSCSSRNSGPYERPSSLLGVRQEEPGHAQCGGHVSAFSSAALPPAATARREFPSRVALWLVDTVCVSPR
uniref:Uncharacterized protein n=1 Tax=Ursus americanus TaxID=9643 RepID=A0A452RWW4_URSAM